MKKNNSPQCFDIDKQARSKVKSQKPCVIWLTGISGSGKSTIANALDKELYSAGMHTYILDGDNIRNGLSIDLGFSDEDREENIRRVGEVSKLMVDAGLVVIVALISPFRKDRQMVRNLFKEGEFIEVFVDTPLEVAEERDVKEFYKRAREGKLKSFTGIDSIYERPVKPEMIVSGFGNIKKTISKIQNHLILRAR